MVASISKAEAWVAYENPEVGDIVLVHAADGKGREATVIEAKKPSFEGAVVAIVKVQAEWLRHKKQSYAVESLELVRRASEESHQLATPAGGDDIDDLALNQSEAEERQRLETEIEAGLQTFYKVGQALSEIKEKRLYRDTHATFELYCQDRWGMRGSTAYRQINAAAVVELLDAEDIKPTAESQLRPLVGLPGEQVSQIWSQLTADGKAPTASQVSAAVAEVTGKQAPAASMLAIAKDPWKESATLRFASPNPEDVAAGMGEITAEYLPKAISKDFSDYYCLDFLSYPGWLYSYLHWGSSMGTPGQIKIHCFGWGETEGCDTPQQFAERFVAQKWAQHTKMLDKRYKAKLRVGLKVRIKSKAYGENLDNVLCRVLEFDKETAVLQPDGTGNKKDARITARKVDFEVGSEYEQDREEKAAVIAAIALPEIPEDLAKECYVAKFHWNDKERFFLETDGSAELDGRYYLRTASHSSAELCFEEARFRLAIFRAGYIPRVNEDNDGKRVFRATKQISIETDEHANPDSVLKQIQDFQDEQERPLKEALAQVAELSERLAKLTAQASPTLKIGDYVEVTNPVDRKSTFSELAIIESFIGAKIKVRWSDGNTDLFLPEMLKFKARQGDQIALAGEEGES